MIGRITGLVVEEEADGTVVVDVNGVGYEVTTPLGAVGRARGLATSERVTLHVHTHVREDALTLFGFATVLEKDVFRTLISVSNVGPKIALAILSAIPAEDLGRAVAARDLSRLVAISGVGKKTAERLMLELKDKLPTGPGGAAGVVRAGGSAATASELDKTALVVGALTRLGYRPIEAERAIGALGAKTETTAVGELIREALAILAH